MRRIILHSTLYALTILSPCSAIYAQGYDVESDRIVADTPEHWGAWSLPGGAVEISEEGEIRPRRMRKNINAVLNATEFAHEETGLGGIRAAGSNLGAAAKAMDGNPDTFWEPDLKDPLRDWWIEINLGRLVNATKVVLRFVDEELGDPFLHSRVLVSTGQRAFIGSDRFNYRLVGKTKKPNVDQRVLEYEILPDMRPEEGWTGGLIQYVLVVVTDSRFDKAEEISEDAYEVLPSDRRGAIEYLRKLGEGWKEVTEKEYGALDPDERGPIRYYRRERPRLAEVEVWTIGDNISLGILNRGGSMEALTASTPLRAFDGVWFSAWLAQFVPPLEKGAVTVDLGATFWVDTIRLLSSGIHYANIISSYELKGSDGSRAPDRTLIWKTLGTWGSKSGYGFHHHFEPTRVRYFMYQNMALGRWITQVSEILVYGEGYLPEVTLTSNLIELGTARNLDTITWEADVPSGTQVEIRTRTGNELREKKHFFNASGVEITELKWNAAPAFARGEVTVEYLPGNDWSPWSQFYIRSGDPITSPSPRRYALIQIKLLSDHPDRAASLRSLALRFSKPLATALAGEISPHRDVPMGVPFEFAFFIKPTFLPSDPGFDQLLLVAPLSMEMDLVDVRLGHALDFRRRTTRDFVRGDDGLFRDPSGASLDVLKDRSDSLSVRLPETVGPGDLDLLCIRFRSSMFSSGVTFGAYVANSSLPEIRQKVDSGDVTYFTSSKGSTVYTAPSPRIVGDVEIGPNPFTPNGDGINDELEIALSVFKIDTAAPVRVSIYDLGARQVAELRQGRGVASGRYRFLWDGERSSGETVPPGAYLCRISVDADFEEESELDRIVYVVY